MSNIRAVFAAGLDAITVHGLHQWDYGRFLEISHPDLPAGLEVHFATVGSKEAIVHTVAGVVGKATVAIPNILLEQARPITAWVYYVDTTRGQTMLTVTMPVKARPRPVLPPAVPDEIADKYTEALGAMNTQIEELKRGNVTVAQALLAQEADEAHYADRAGTANEATKATCDKNGKDITVIYQTKDRGVFQPAMYHTFAAGEVYQARVIIGGISYYAVISVTDGNDSCASLGDNLGTQYTLVIDRNKTVYVYAVEGGSYQGEITPTSVMFRQI